jgi:hypothetical protein
MEVHRRLNPLFHLPVSGDHCSVAERAIVSYPGGHRHGALPFRAHPPVRPNVGDSSQTALGTTCSRNCPRRVEEGSWMSKILSGWPLPPI